MDGHKGEIQTTGLQEMPCAPNPGRFGVAGNNQRGSTIEARKERRRIGQSTMHDNIHSYVHGCMVILYSHKEQRMMLYVDIEFIRLFDHICHHSKGEG